jgi:hypothetical protein
VAGADVGDGFADLSQRIGPVEHGGELPRFDEAAQRVQVRIIQLGNEEAELLAHKRLQHVQLE